MKNACVGKGTPVHLQHFKSFTQSPTGSAWLKSHKYAMKCFIFCVVGNS